MMNYKVPLILAVLSGSFPSLSAEEILRSPNSQIEVAFEHEGGKIFYSSKFKGEEIISSSQLGLQAQEKDALKVAEVIEGSADRTWESVWGMRREHRDYFNELQFKMAGESEQIITFRAYDDGIAFRYEIPEGAAFKNEAYARETSEVSFVSEKPTAWFPLTMVMASDEVDLNSWEPMDKGTKLTRNERYEGRPPIIRTPFTLKLSQKVYLSVHEAAVFQTEEAFLHLDGQTLSYVTDPKSAAGRKTPWRTVTISDRPGGLIESSLILNLNEPSKIKDTSWIKPGVTMWDWRNHGAKADDGFVYHLDTASYLRYIDFAAEAGVEYMLIDAEWYGPERNGKSDPKTAIPEIDMEKVCSYAKEKGVGMWLYINFKAVNNFDQDETFKQYQEWGVKGIKHGFGKSGPDDFKVAAKCAEYELMYTRHESQKPTGMSRTYPNICPLSMSTACSTLGHALPPRPAV